VSEMMPYVSSEDGGSSLAWPGLTISSPLATLAPWVALLLLVELMYRGFAPLTARRESSDLVDMSSSLLDIRTGMLRLIYTKAVALSGIANWKQF
jgi:hypothetical protein